MQPGSSSSSSSPCREGNGATASSSARQRSAAFLRASQLPPFSAFSTRSSNGKISAWTLLTRWENLGVCQGVLGIQFFLVWSLRSCLKKPRGSLRSCLRGCVFFSLSKEENKWRPRFLWGPFFDCGVFPAVGEGGEFGNIRSYRYDMKVKFIADSAHGLGFGPTLQFLLPQQGGHPSHIMVVIRPRDEDGDQQTVPMERG